MLSQIFVALLVGVSGQGRVNEMKDCCRHIPLKVGYFSENITPFQAYDAETGQRSGGLVDLSELILETMGYAVEWVDMGRTGDTIGADSAPSYFAMIASGEVDVTFSAPSFGYGPEAVPGAPATAFLTTVPLIDLETRAVIRKREAPRRVFSIFEPFSFQLWLTILGTLVVGAGFLYVLDQLDPREAHVNAGPGGPAAFLYHATSVLLDGDEYEWRSAAARLFRIGLLFFALVVTSTYTASLTARLTTRTYELAGPTTYAELRRASACFIYEEVTAGWPGNIVDSVVAAPASYTWRERVDFCMASLDKGRVDSVMVDFATATERLLERCKARFVLSLPLPGAYLPGLVAPGAFALQRNISRAIAAAKLDRRYVQTHTDSFRADGNCENSGDPTLVSAFGVGALRITLKSMAGVFLIFTSFVAAAFVAALLERWGFFPDCFQVRRAARRASKEALSYLGGSSKPSPEPVARFRGSLEDFLDEVRTRSRGAAPVGAAFLPIPEERTPRHYEEFAPSTPRFP